MKLKYEEQLKFLTLLEHSLEIAVVGFIPRFLELGTELQH